MIKRSLSLLLALTISFSLFATNEDSKIFLPKEGSTYEKDNDWLTTLLLGSVLGLGAGAWLSKYADEEWHGDHASSTYSSVFFSPSDTYLVFVTEQEIRLYETASSKAPVIFSVSNIKEVKFTNDEKYLIAHTDYRGHIWKVNGEWHSYFQDSTHFRSFTYCQETKDGIEWALSKGNSTDIIRNKDPISLRTDEEVKSLQRSPNGRFYLGIHDNSASLFRARDGTKVNTFKPNSWHYYLKRCFRR